MLWKAFSCDNNGSYTSGKHGANWVASRIFFFIYKDSQALVTVSNQVKMPGRAEWELCSFPGMSDWTSAYMCPAFHGKPSFNGLGDNSVFILLNRDIPFPRADQCDIWIEQLSPVPSNYSIRASYCHKGSLQLRQQPPRGEGAPKEEGP